MPIAGSTRVNITLVEADGTLTKVNASGPALTESEAETLLETVRTRSSDTDWIACCGSLPRGLPPSGTRSWWHAATGPERGSPSTAPAPPCSPHCASGPM